MIVLDLLQHAVNVNGTPESVRAEALPLFPIQTLQHLDRDGVRRCQDLLGHGDIFGVWSTPRMWVQKNTQTRIDLHERILSFLPDTMQSRVYAAKLSHMQRRELDPILVILDEAVLWITRYALLCRMGPAGMKMGKGRSLDTSTLYSLVHTLLPPLLSLAIQRRLDSAPEILTDHELISALQPSDLDTFTKNLRGKLSNEFKRMYMLQDMGLWQDVPQRSIFIKGRTTGIKGPSKARPMEKMIRQFQPLPDDYVAEMGRRVLWVIQDLGPNLIHCFNAIPNIFTRVELSSNTGYYIKIRQKRLADYFSQHSWCDRKGKVIDAPPFPLMLSVVGLKNCKDYSPEYAFEWPPKNWAQIRGLAVTLQFAHLWVALMAMAGRHGEILSLQRDCVEFARDDKPYVNGKTFKLVRRLDGEMREWPLPDIAVDAFAQQVKLVEAWEKIAAFEAGSATSGEFYSLSKGNYLWGSLGNGLANPEKQLDAIGGNLLRLAETLGMELKPGGANLHPHRFRKTIARLAGIALIGSPRILMQVFGHKDIQMTLSYILTDKALATEIETVARELRVMRCEEVITDIRVNEGSALAYGGHGGPGARSISQAIQNHEQQLHRTGNAWGVSSTRELALILTMNGETWTQVHPHVLCTKSIGEAGECSTRLGSPEPSSCQSSCMHRIEEKTARRDVQELIPVLVTEYRAARQEGDLMVMAELGEQIRQNVGRFEDFQAIWQADPDVAEVLGAA